MKNKNYKEIVLKIHKEALADMNYSNKLQSKTNENIKTLATLCFNQKAVYTVFITLGIYKIVHKEQDIRNHQTQIEGGFSGRSIDTMYITPTLKEVGLPSMAESGWLTRSLEQPYPYTLNYEGKISNKSVKKAFLELVDDIQTKNINPKYILVELLKIVIELQKKSKIVINPLKNPEKLTILKLMNILDKQFSFKYSSFGGSKLPVLAFFAIYQILIKELSRYKDCELKSLGSHTSSDRTSKSAGDIEIFKSNNQLFEAIEIKLDKAIDSNMLRIVKEKVECYNPTRYYILSYYEILKEQQSEIEQIIDETKKIHGCQIVANGLIPTLKYYFRLISNLEEFVDIYSNLIENDNELKNIHKEKWNELLKELDNEL
jgi:DNA (cytosine-5)-methyltransferase 1